MQNILDKDTGQKERALVIIGHGSKRVATAITTTEMHASTIRKLGIFDAVRTAYVNGEQPISACLDNLDVDHITIVPNFACDGYLSQVLIPDQLQLLGPVTQRIGRNGRQTIELTDAVGSHPMIPVVAVKRVRTLQLEKGITPETTDVIVVGHGTNKSRASADATSALALRIQSEGLTNDARALFLDQTPKLDTWQSLCCKPNIIVLPFLMSLGSHARHDVPRAFGIDLESDKLNASLESGINPYGPHAVGDHNVWICPPIGMDSLMTSIILERVNTTVAMQVVTAS